MDQFLTEVREAMIQRGLGPSSAQAEINYDPNGLLELRAKGMTADDVAAVLIRQARVRQSAVQ